MRGVTMNGDRSGVDRLRGRQRRRWLFAVGALLLLAIDLVVMWSSGSLPDRLSDIPPDMAIGAAVGMLIGAAISYRFICRLNDEHDVRARRIAGQAGFTAFLLAYPVWGLLAIGHLLPAVDGIVLYLGVCVIYFATFLWWKYR